MKIYKYRLQLAKSQVIFPNAIAKPLCVQIQNGQPTLWMQLEDEYMDEHAGKTVSSRVEVSCIGTGLEVENPSGTYLSTVQHDGFVWHFYCNSHPFYKEVK